MRAINRCLLVLFALSLAGVMIAVSPWFAVPFALAVLGGALGTEPEPEPLLLNLDIEFKWTEAPDNPQQNHRTPPERVSPPSRIP